MIKKWKTFPASSFFLCFRRVEQLFFQRRFWETDKRVEEERKPAVLRRLPFLKASYYTLEGWAGRRLLSETLESNSHLILIWAHFQFQVCNSSRGDLESNRMNKLGSERSPYLLQHASNPVHWYPWGSQAFEAAKESNKLIFLSVGYSTCHWCHVMERESFENPEVTSCC